LLDLYDDDVVAAEIVYFASIQGIRPVITPTIGHAMVDMANEDKSRDAQAALFALRSGYYGVEYPTLDPEAKDESQIRVNTGLAGFAADQIIEAHGLSGKDRTTALVLAEASIMKADYAILEDEELENINCRRVNEILAERGMVPLKIRNRLAFYGEISGQRES
jgi:hypothetical protein